MKHIFHNIQHTARAATVLLLALLAVQTAGAQEDIPEVSNAPGLAEAFDDTNVSVINVTDNITGVGTFSLNRALTINLNGNTISGDGLHIDAFEGCSLTINGGGSVGNIISGDADRAAIDNLGTVTLSHVNITTNSDHAIGGLGTLNIGDNVSFNGWTDMPFNTTKFNIIEGGNYNYDPGNPRANVVATVTVGGTPRYFENSDAALAYIVSQPAHFSVNDAGTEYTIHTANGWDLFCELLEAGETFSGKTVELANDITVTRMAGGQPFTGTFDGQNHKLTLAYGTADAPVDAQFVAPFVETASGTSPVFRNLTIDGTIYATHTAATDHDHVGGLIGHLFGDVTIEHCVSRVEIHAKGGAGGFVGLCEHSVSFTDCHSAAVVHSADGNNSGFVAWSRSSGWEINFTGCLFDGKLLQQNGTGHSNGGFIGWKGDAKIVNITNCLCAPAPLADGEMMATDGSATFSREHSNYPATINNSYYTAAFDIAQGKQAHTVTAGTDVTVAHAGVATHYATSGITAYKANSSDVNYTAGIAYAPDGDTPATLYAGSGDVVSLTLGHEDRQGYTFNYQASAGTLSGSTLTMPDADVTITVGLSVIDWATESDGDADHPYMIYNKDQLDLLAQRVNNGTSDYKDKYFKLGNDIIYDPDELTIDNDNDGTNDSNYKAIGYNGRSFNGHFDGDNKTVSGIRIYKGGTGDGDRYQGLFGRTGSDADIRNVTLADARITGKDYTGGIVGENVGTVSNCHVAASVFIRAVQKEAHSHGGIVGRNSSTVTNCTSRSTLTIAKGITGCQQYGGIVGLNFGTLTDNLAIGAVVPAAAFNTNGAICGNWDGTMARNYYRACKVASENVTQGGVGCDNRDVTENNGAVPACTLTLDTGITTTSETVINIDDEDYYAGTITLSGDLPDGAPEHYTYAYTVNGNAISGNTFIISADATVGIGLGPADWANEGNSGDDEDHAYIIYNKDQLNLLAHRVNGTNSETANDYEGKYFKLGNDITYNPDELTIDNDNDGTNDSNYEAINGFNGHFDGDDKTVSGIRIYKSAYYGDGYQGLFGLTGSSADIHNVTLANADITGGDYTGGIVGENEGTVSNCHVTATVAIHTVQPDVCDHGGIVGANYGTVSECFSAATLTIDDASNSKYYGGIAGRNYGTLSDNLAIGATVPAAADNSYGAICGWNYDGTLENNYYAACTVAGTENATGVGCNNADVTANDGAVSIHTLTLADGITTTTAVTVTHAGTGYYAQGTAIALSYSGTPGDAPQGYQYGYTVSAGTISGSTLTMPDQDVTVSFGLRSTHEPVEVSYVDAGGNTQTAQAIALDGTEYYLGQNNQETWYFVGLPTVAFDHTLYLYGDVNLILADGCTMNVTGSDGIVVNDGGSLTIYGQTDGTGTLNATGGDNDNGIYTDSGTINISGGTVTATGGGGISTDSGTINISGGRVTATGVSGIYTNNGTITISGGRVTATSDNGYGIHSNSGDITISGGRVTATATATATSEYNAGIYTYSGNITLGCTTASDFIYASSYFVGSGGRLNIAGGQTLYDEDDNSYSGTYYGFIILAGKTLRPLRNVLALYDSEDNSEAISDNNEQQRNVILYGRTLYKDGDWNTLCLPFDIDDFSGTPLEGATVKELNATTSNLDNGTLTLNFTDADVIEAGKPYIVRWGTPEDNPGGTIVDPVFEGVTISSTTPTAVTFTGGSFVGQYSPFSITADNIDEIILLSTGNRLGYSQNPRTLRSFRAHFEVPVGGGGSLVREFVLNFDGETTEIISPAEIKEITESAGAWYGLDGRKLDAKPTKKGVYIRNGKKIVIK